MTQAVHRLGHHTKAGLAAVRSGLTVTTDPPHDQLRVAHDQHLGRQAKTFQRAGTDVFDQHVAFISQLAHDVLRGGAFQIQTTERLLRASTCHLTEVLSFRKHHWRSGSPAPGGSILITSAPDSASVLAANGPAINWPGSSTRRPASGPSDAAALETVGSGVDVGMVALEGSGIDQGQNLDRD